MKVYKQDEKRFLSSFSSLPIFKAGNVVKMWVDKWTFSAGFRGSEKHSGWWIVSWEIENVGSVAAVLGIYAIIVKILFVQRSDVCWWNCFAIFYLLFWWRSWSFLPLRPAFCISGFPLISELAADLSLCQKTVSFQEQKDFEFEIILLSYWIDYCLCCNYSSLGLEQVLYIGWKQL